jgi:malate dehydrogenase (quinone)
MAENRPVSEPDIVMVGAGIMSATLAVFLKELEPTLTVEMFETLDDAAEESSDAWNNAGTGHAALCELNYTPERSDGSIDISKALDVNVEFDLSRQLWSYLVTKGAIADPRSFIHPCPHMSFVRGAEDVAFLKKRHAALSAHHTYEGMEYTEDKQQIAEWVPLVMEGRAPNETVAVTRIITGADVDYGALTRQLVGYLQRLPVTAWTISVARAAGAGGWTPRTRGPATGDRPPQNSSFSAPAAARCRCCKSPLSPRKKAMAGFPSAASGCAVTIPS